MPVDHGAAVIETERLLLRQPLLEDVDFSGRLKREGCVAILPLHITASARRYVRRGVARQIIVNAIVLGLFSLGISPARLKRIYEGLR